MTVTNMEISSFNYDMYKFTKTMRSIFRALGGGSLSI